MMNARALMLLLLLSPSIAAPAFAVRPDAARYFSANRKYSAAISLYPGKDRSRCSFSKGRSILWTRDLPFVPGFAALANSGASIVFVGGRVGETQNYRSLSFYRGNGMPLGEIFFIAGDEGANGRRVDAVKVSGDGNYALLANSSAPNARVSFYYVPRAGLLWERYAGFENLDSVLMDENGTAVLLTTFEESSGDNAFAYITGTGALLWEQCLESNHSFDRPLAELSRDGKRFRIYDTHRRRWLKYVNRDGTIDSQ